jgi:hypothetical protein
MKYDDSANGSEEIERQVYDAFLARGWIIPQTEAEVELDEFTRN